MKNMRKSITLWVVAGFTLGLAPCAWGEPFPIYPPESNPFITWETTFPYQRNVTLNLMAVPPGGPTPIGIPGALYEGYNDPLLWSSDYVSLTGGAFWLPGLGVILPPNGTGSVILHLDNWVRDWPFKHLYMNLTATGAGSLGVMYNLPAGYSYTSGWDTLVGTPPGTVDWFVWAEFQPNPPWEEVIIWNPLPEPITLQRWHVATECVPAPAAVLLGALGLATAGWRLRKRA
jgi:hypothetical protein